MAEIDSILSGLPDHLIFFPRKTARRAFANATDYDIPVGDGVTVGARFHLRDGSWPTVLYFHGNGETVPDYDTISFAFAECGLNLFVADYRGYGWSSGRPSLRTILPDAHRVAEFFFDLLPEGAPKPFLMGRSLGSLCASDLADRLRDRFAGVIVESGFSDIRPVLALFGFPPAESDLVGEYFSNRDKLARADVPVLIIHGDLDTLISSDAARENFAAIGHERKALKLLSQAGHNDLLAFAPEYFGAIREFVAGGR